MGKRWNKSGFLIENWKRKRTRGQFVSKVSLIWQALSAPQLSRGFCERTLALYSCGFVSINHLIAPIETYPSENGSLSFVSLPNEVGSIRKVSKES